MIYMIFFSIFLTSCLTDNKDKKADEFKEKIMRNVQGEWEVEQQTITLRNCSNIDSEWTETYQYKLEINENNYKFKSYPIKTTLGDTVFLEGEFTILNSVESYLARPLDTMYYSLIFHDYKGYKGLNCETNYGHLLYGNTDPNEIVLEERESAQPCASFSRYESRNCTKLNDEQYIVFKKIN